MDNSARNPPSDKPVAQAWSQYQALADRYNQLIQRREPVPDDMVRDLVYLAGQVAAAYSLESNWPERSREDWGVPREHFPPALAQHVARNLLILGHGDLPSWVGALRRRGAPKGHPAMEQDILTAVMYRKAADKGWVRDKTPVKTIADAYGVSRQAVQKWVDARAHASPQSLNFKTEEEIRAAFEAAAARYREWGRAPGIMRPHGKTS
jgi:hypothetical protein